MADVLSPAAPGTKCGKRVGESRYAQPCGDDAVCTETARYETRHTCAKHAPRAWHPVVETRYSVSRNWQGELKLTAVPIVSRTAKQVKLRDSASITGHRLVMPAHEYDTLFSETPVEAAEDAHRWAVRAVESQRAALVQAEQREADAVAFLAALPVEVADV